MNTFFKINFRDNFSSLRSAAGTVLLTIAMSGCVAPPSVYDMRRADFGPFISRNNFENLVRSEHGFFDPYSAMITCTEPRKGWADYLYTPKYGYLSHCKYNAKNKMGGYVGEQSQNFITSDGKLFPIYPGDWKYLE